MRTKKGRDKVNMRWMPGREENGQNTGDTYPLLTTPASTPPPTPGRDTHRTGPCSLFSLANKSILVVDQMEKNFYRKMIEKWGSGG